jgi:hypothetical protein
MSNAVGLVWRHRRLLWWIFALNLALAWLSSLTLRAALRPVLDNSLESARLVTGFDVSTLVLLLQQPEVPAETLAPSAIFAAALWFVAMLALDGGVVTTYLEDRRLPFAEFCARCGIYFWRMARLALYGLLPFGGLMAAHGALGDWTGKLSRNAPQPRLGFEINVAGTLLILMTALFVRLWFDLAQARTVQSNERGLLRLLLRSFAPALRSGLYLRYIGIALFAVASAALGIALWIRLPHQAIVASFVVLELVTLAQIAARLWMKAACARWAALQPEPEFMSEALETTLTAQ